MSDWDQEIGTDELDHVFLKTQIVSVEEGVICSNDKNESISYQGSPPFFRPVTRKDILISPDEVGGYKMCGNTQIRYIHNLSW